MIAPIVRAIPIPEIPQAIAPASGSGNFQDLLQSSIAKVEQAHDEAAKSIGNFLTGDGDDIHTVAIAAQRAELSMELFLQVRGKVISAYQEIMRMQM
ncbi:MAG: flagellar hook-basal body complex protein FliE [Acidobacteriota bacterium]|nr:flagellar hook-basal body complex protein FliE [Acidobacteriota bacterium]